MVRKRGRENEMERAVYEQNAYPHGQVLPVHVWSAVNARCGTGMVDAKVVKVAVQRWYAEGLRALLVSCRDQGEFPRKYKVHAFAARNNQHERERGKGERT